jgi:hypothetical protein
LTPTPQPDAGRDGGYAPCDAGPLPLCAQEKLEAGLPLVECFCGRVVSCDYFDPRGLLDFPDLLRSCAFAAVRPCNYHVGGILYTQPEDASVDSSLESDSGRDPCLYAMSYWLSSSSHQACRDELIAQGLWSEHDEEYFCRQVFMATHGGDR